MECWKQLHTVIYQSPMCACVSIHVFYCCGSAGWKDLQYCSFTHRGSSRLTLKKLLSAVRVSCMGWDVFSYHATCHLLPPLGQEGITLALLVYLFQFFLSPVEILLPQQTSTITDSCWNHRVFRSFSCTSKVLGILTRYSLLCPFQ